MKTATKDRPKKFRESYYVKAHRLAQSGHSKREIAECLGVSWAEFCRWLKQKPALREAIDSAKTVNPNKGNSSHNRYDKPDGLRFIDYAYLRLPEELQRLWNKLEKLTDPDQENGEPQNATELIESLFTRTGVKHARMHLYFHALIRTNFNANAACRIVNVSKTAVDKWVKEEPEFRALIAQLPEMKRDYAEAALWRLIAAGDGSCTQFANRCLNPAIYNPPKNHVVKGSIVHATADMAQVLDLIPLEQRRSLLEAIKKAKELKQLPPAEIVNK